MASQAPAEVNEYDWYNDRQENNSTSHEISHLRDVTPAEDIAIKI